jgi:hypothetical protein
MGWQWYVMRRVVEILLTVVLIKAFAGCSSAHEILTTFYKFDTLQQLGSIFAGVVVITGIADIVIAVWNWSRGLVVVIIYIVTLARSIWNWLKGPGPIL